VPSTDDFDDLVKKFRLLGVRDPEGWARSQVDECINQLHRALFLRQAWEFVVSEGDDGWMASEVAAAKDDPAGAYAGIGQALRRLLDAGADRRDLADLVRGMQGRLLFDLCHLLEDPGAVEPTLDGLGWSLVETDEDFEPTAEAISGLHESVLEMDPTGREMRPRPLN
jgi:hypothetical protein